MIRICIKPTTFTLTSIQDDQNIYIDIDHRVNKKLALKQHSELVKAFQNVILYTINPVDSVPDIVFTANAGLCLPRLKETVILLPYMKYPQRKDELKYLKEIFSNYKTIPFPGTLSAPFEGQAELKWFHGGMKAVGGYGHRSTKKSFDILNTLFKKTYQEYNLTPPELLVIPLKSNKYYHLDVAMLEFDNKCIVHKQAFSVDSIKKLKNFLGPSNVFIIDTNDSFCLNAVVDGDNLITHKLDTRLKKELEDITGKHIKMVDTSEFEKSGGSVRCMTLDIT
jgi:N-dimethylarginine dimethylaminohydrolase